MDNCPLRGWYAGYSCIYGTQLGNPQSPVLRNFDINSPKVGLNDLGTYIKVHFRDIGLLSPRRFEELVADVFAHHGLRVALTQQTRDGGADILLLHNDSGVIESVIECKRYRADRLIGVAAVRTLVGVAVDWGTRRASLVTSSDFSSGARFKADDYASKGYAIDLVAASDLLRMLQVYNERIPALASLTPGLRLDIIQANLKILEEQAKEAAYLATIPGIG